MLLFRNLVETPESSYSGTGNAGIRHVGGCPLFGGTPGLEVQARRRTRSGMSVHGPWGGPDAARLVSLGIIACKSGICRPAASQAMNAQYRARHGRG